VALGQSHRRVVGRVALADGETVGIRQDQRLAFPPVPQLRVNAGRIEVPVELADHPGRVPEWAQERHLRRARPVRAHLGERLQERQIPPAVRGLVGHIEDDDIDTRIREHLSVLPQHIGVIGLVVAEERLPPVVESVHRPPERVVLVFNGTRIGGEDLADIEGASPSGVLAQPQEVEHAHMAVCPWWATLGIARDLAPQSICGHPGIAEHVTRLGGHDYGGPHGEGRGEGGPAWSQGVSGSRASHRAAAFRLAGSARGIQLSVWNRVVSVPLPRYGRGPSTRGLGPGLAEDRDG